MAQSEQNQTMAEIRATQALLKESIEESRRLTEKTQELDKHRKETAEDD